MYKQKLARKEQGIQLVEFGVSLYLLAMALVIPLIGVSNLGFSLLVGQLSTLRAVNLAAEAPTNDLALSCAADELERNTKEGLGGWAHLRSIGGYLGSGADLYIDAQPKNGAPKVNFEPNKPLRKQADALTNSYDYRLVSHFQAGPFLQFSSINIPFLTKPVTLNFSASCPVECPESLNLSLDGNTLVDSDK